MARFQRLHIELDVAEGKALLSQVLDLSPVDSHVYQGALLTLSTATISQSMQVPGLPQTEEDDVDVDEEILQMAEFVLQRTSRQDPSAHALSVKVGTLLRDRSHRLGDLADIERSIAMLEDAVQLTPDSHRDKPSRLNNLSSSLLARFDLLGDPVDIHKSISMRENALRLILPGHPDKPSWLNDLGNLLLRRYKRLGDLADIGTSISRLEEVVELTSDGHPNKPTMLSNPGSALST